MKLTKNQYEAISHIDGNLQIIACAGSGKTEVISRRIAHILQSKSDVNPENIVAFTFTEKAAASLKKRIEKAVGSTVQGMYIGTIHGFCRFLLNRYTNKFNDFKVLDTVKNHLFVTRYAEICGMKSLGLNGTLRASQLFLQCIDKLIDDYDNIDNWLDKHREVLDKYISCLYNHKYIDFSLLIFEALRQIEENAEVELFLSKIKYLVVDEYQDVNDIQEKLIKAIANAGANICVVGDDDQTIYQFRGSNANNMIEFKNHYNNVHQVLLSKNFRSQGAIIDVARTVIQCNINRISKDMISCAESEQSNVCAKGYASVEDEYSGIVKKILILHKKGIPFNQMAILVRKGKHIVSIAKKLESEQIPFNADSSDEFFSGNYFKRFVNTLSVLDTVDKVKLYEQWNDIVERKQFNIGFKFLRNCSRGEHQRLVDIIKGFCDKIEFLNDDLPDLQNRIEDLEGICKILEDYDEIYGDYQLSARISGLLKFLELHAAEEYKYHRFRQIKEEKDEVQLMTIHKSKGLEFHTVFLPRLNKKEFPVTKMGGKKYYTVLGGVFEVNKNKYESDVEDERKLFYVAITRAKINLFISYTLAKQPVSEFVKNASKSSELQINMEDLIYEPKKIKNEVQKKIKNEVQEKIDKEILKKARESLYSYYHTANHFFPGIILEYSDICAQGPEAIIEEAKKLGLI